MGCCGVTRPCTRPCTDCRAGLLPPHAFNLAPMPSTLQRMHHTASTADSFNRWEAGHVLAKKLMRELYQAAAQSTEVGAALLAF